MAIMDIIGVGENDTDLERTTFAHEGLVICVEFQVVGYDYTEFDQIDLVIPVYYVCIADGYLPIDCID